jgi:hypothetical protein
MVNRAKQSTFDSSDNLTVTDIPALKALPRERQEGVIFVQGALAANDGGGGTWMWTAGSTDTPNDVLISQPDDDSGGRWFRIIHNDIADFAWFGESDNKLANLNAQGTFANGLVLYVDDGDLSGFFKYDNDELINPNTDHRVNGWIRINDFNFDTNNLVLTNGAKITGSADADLTKDGFGDFNSPQDLPTVNQVNQLIQDNLVASQIERAPGNNLIVDFGEDVSTAFIYVAGTGTDRGLLKNGIDYFFPNPGTPNIIELSNTFPDAILTAYFFQGPAPATNPGVLVKHINGSTHTISNADVDRYLICTDPLGCEITVPDTGVFNDIFVCIIKAETAGRVFFSGPGTIDEISGYNTVIEDGGVVALFGGLNEGEFTLTGDTRDFP